MLNSYPLSNFGQYAELYSNRQDKQQKNLQVQHATKIPTKNSHFTKTVTNQHTTNIAIFSHDSILGEVQRETVRYAQLLFCQNKHNIQHAIHVQSWIKFCC